MKERTHIKAFTYKEKIPGVLSGDIRQTMRVYLRNAPEKSVSEGDTILFHGWEGRPYRSPWSWRLRVKVLKAPLCQAYPEGIYYPDGHLIPWDSVFANLLAKLDGIKPAKGTELKAVLERLNGPITEVGVGLQVITWAWPPIECVADGGSR